MDLETPSGDTCCPPETQMALGVSSNSPSADGHAQEDSVEILEDSRSKQEEVLIQKPNSDSNIHEHLKTSSSTTGVKKSKATNRTAATPSKPYPFMGYQILPIIPQPVLFPFMPKNHVGYSSGYSHFGSSPQPELLSTTNLYIKGLSENCTDEDLEAMCKNYGKIVSTKAILDKKLGICKGYGFVDFQEPADAQRAVHSLQSNGILAQFAKLQEQDPTNLYMSNLPKNYTEKNLEQLLAPYGTIISTRVLRDLGGGSRGVGFVRLDSHDHCQKAIEKLNGSVLPGFEEDDSLEPLNIKFADGSTNKKKPDWKDDIMTWKDYGMHDYLCDVSAVPSMLAPSNGYLGSRIMSPSVVSASPYLHQSSHMATGYQVQAGNNSSISSWHNPPNPYYHLSPGNPNGTDHSIHNLASQMNAMQLPSQTPNGSTSARTGSTTANGPVTIPTHAAQYTQQPPGWTIRLSHTTPHHYIQQHT